MEVSCNYKEIKKKILEENKKYKYICLKGEKGERGEMGPATIKVGTTELVDAGSPAEVLNEGSNKDVVLHFKLPRGMQGEKGEKGDPGPTTIKIGDVITLNPEEEAEVINIGTDTDLVLEFRIPKGMQGVKGDKGEIGPRGLPGEIGITEHINVEETETVDPSEDAQVLDTFENNVHNLSFFIPKGEKGDAGPQGPAGSSFISSYGMLYSMSDGQLSVNQGVDTIVPMGEKGPALFTEYGENSITIKENGVYLISYLLCGGANEECSITMSVRANDLLQPASSATSEFQANVINSISGSTIASLTPDDVVTLNVKASTNVTLSFNGSTNAILSVIKIH